MKVFTQVGQKNYDQVKPENINDNTRAVIGEYNGRLDGQNFPVDTIDKFKFAPPTLTSQSTVNVYGFKHTGATVASMRFDLFATAEAQYNYCPSSVRGISFNAMTTSNYAFYNYINFTTVGLDILGNCYVVARANVTYGPGSGVAGKYGFRVYYGSIVAMSTAAANKNYITDCHTGVRIETGSGVASAAGQNFNNIGAGGSVAEDGEATWST